MALSRTAKAVATAFTVSGVVHLVRPQTFDLAMPRWIPRERHRDLIVASGVAELVCAAGLAVPATRPVAGLASAGLLLAVYPANVQMAIDAQRGDNLPYRVGTLLRLPLQGPMIKATWDLWRRR